MSDRRTAMTAEESEGLPYRIVNNILMSPMAAINTFYQWIPNTSEYEIKIKYNRLASNTGARWAIGAHTRWKVDGIGVCISISGLSVNQDQITCYYSTQNVNAQSYSAEYQTDRWFTLKFLNSKRFYIDNSEKVTMSDGTITSNYLCIGGLSSEYDSRSGTLNFSFLKFRENGNIVRNFIPVQWIASDEYCGQYGIVDTIGNICPTTNTIFYPNANPSGGTITEG